MNNLKQYKNKKDKTDSMPLKQLKQAEKEYNTYFTDKKRVKDILEILFSLNTRIEAFLAECPSEGLVSEEYDKKKKELTAFLTNLNI